jgi:hypothetical protein
LRPPGSPMPCSLSPLKPSIDASIAPSRSAATAAATTARSPTRTVNPCHSLLPSRKTFAFPHQLALIRRR